MPDPSPFALSKEDQLLLEATAALAYPALQALETAAQSLEDDLKDALREVAAEPLVVDYTDVESPGAAYEAHRRASNLAFVRAHLAGVRAHRDALAAFELMNAVAQGIAGAWAADEEDRDA